MKKAFIVFLFVPSVIVAQNNEYKKTLKGVETVKIKTGTTLKIVANNSNELIIKNASKNNEKSLKKVLGVVIDKGLSELYELNGKKENKKDKTKGLTPIYAGGKDNSNGFGFSVTKNGKTLLLKDLKSHFQRKGIQISLPKNVNIIADGNSLGNIYIDGFSSEVEAETSVGRITMKNVTGPITAHSSVGVINVDFTNVNQTAPITISSAVGEIDVSMPKNTKASLDIKTHGMVYTNFNLESPKEEDVKNVTRKKIYGHINNGGVKIKLKSSMGNIYLRKK